jgi:hypothetical protein
MIKKLLLIVKILVLTTTVSAQCPAEGQTNNVKIQRLNELKNRDVNTTQKPKSVIIDSVLADGVDSNRFSNSDYVVMDAWVVDFKNGGPESCNCKSDDKSDWDVHIVVGKDTNATDAECMVVEITPKLKQKLNLYEVNQFGNRIWHHQVRIYGYMMWDFEHARNSVNTAKEGTRDKYRKTAWEIHPVTEMDFIQ